MTRSTRLLMFTLLAGLGIMSACAADQMEHPIRFDRPAQVGQKADITGAAASQVIIATQIAGAAQPAKTRALAVTYQGRADVLEVDPDSAQPVKLALTFTRFEVTTPDGVSEPLPKDGVVVAQLRDGRAVFSLKKGRLSGLANQALRLAFPLSNRADDDAVFGTSRGRKVGESWDIDPVQAAKTLAAKGIEIAPGDLTGRATLVGLKKAGSIECLDIQATLKAGAMALTREQLPPGLKIDQSSLNMTFSGLFPVDQALPPAAAAVSMQFIIRLSGHDEQGRTVRQVVSGKTSDKGTVAPVK